MTPHTELVPCRPTVVVIDDDEAVRQSVEFLLRTSGIAAKTYGSASTFLATLPKIDFGCVITDVRMPDISGIDLLRRLGERGFNIPVIVITGHGDIALAVEAMKAGAVDFLEKPFDDELLLRSVRSALNRSQANAERESERAELDARIAALTSREREIYRANPMTKMQGIRTLLGIPWTPEVAICTPMAKSFTHLRVLATS